MKDEFEAGPAHVPTRKKRERTLEKWAKDYAKANGWLCRKHRTPGHNGAPDDWFAKNGHLFFVEFKKEGEEPSREQLLQHQEYQAAGMQVYVCDNKVQFQNIIAIQNARAR